VRAIHTQHNFFLHILVSLMAKPTRSIVFWCGENTTRPGLLSTRVVVRPCRIAGI
jgi:hypothetical protein